MNRIVNADGLPDPKGFAHAVLAGNTVYLAGQIGDGETLVEQFDNAAAKLVTALRAAGGTAEDLVSLQIFVTELSEYVDSLPGLGRVWHRHFGHHYPAMGLFGVSALFEPNAKVELMAIAVLQS
jgi:enamine deaminase RidA (YjgF/YER057c/UK114 family)